jgi:ligand-binding sensor domain-containing protein
MVHSSLGVSPGNNPFQLMGDPTMRMTDSTPSMLLALVIWCAAGCADPLDPPPPRPVWAAFKGPDKPLRSNHVNAILTNRAGQTWIATDSGVTFYERGSWGAIVDSFTYLHYEPGTPVVEARVTAITQGKDGSLWFGTGGGGIRRFFQTSATGGIRWIRYQEPEISSNVISGLACEATVNGDVWVATPLFGVDRFIPSAGDPTFGEWRNYTTTQVPEFQSNQIFAVGVNINDNSVWVSTLFTLVAFFNDIVGWREYQSSPSYPYRIISIASDLSDNLWFGKLDGAARMDRYRLWTYYTNATTGGNLPRGTVYAVTTDYFNTRWFGTVGGLARYRDTTWTVFNRNNTPELLSDTITALAYDYKGNLWIGTPHGVNIYNESGTTF